MSPRTEVFVASVGPRVAGTDTERVQFGGAFSGASIVAPIGKYKVGQKLYLNDASGGGAGTVSKVEAEPGTPGFDLKVADGEVRAEGDGSTEHNANAAVKAQGATPGEATTKKEPTAADEPAMAPIKDVRVAK